MSTTREGRFRYVVGTRSLLRLVAEERSDRAGRVYLRFWNAQKGNWTRESTELFVRTESGKRSKALEQHAIEKIDARWVELLRQLETGGTPASSSYTMADGFSRAMQIGSGIFPTRTDHARDMSSALKRALSFLPPGQTWEDFRPASYRSLWRAIAAHYVADRAVALTEIRAPRGGRRATEMCIISIIRVRTWLVENELIEPGYALPPRNWVQNFYEEWARITADAEIVAPPPRHSALELGQLLLASEEADPRLALLLELAAEARPGQVVRCRRTHLTLEGGAMNLGSLVVPGRGRKRGVLIDFDKKQRAALDFALQKGYLRDLESASSAGTISDYPLFPSGPLGRGVAKATANESALPRSVGDWFDALERKAGIEKVRGRGRYGVRRVLTDLAADVQTDARVLNWLTGHVPEGTRERHYQAKQNDSVRLAAVKARRAARNLAIKAARAAQKTAKR